MRRDLPRNLDPFIVNVALPDMAQSPGGVALSDMSWVLNAYAITIFVAIVGDVDSPSGLLTPFDRGWSVMMAITALSFVPLTLLLRRN